MKKLSIILCSALALNFAFASSLVDEAKSLGLMPLPKDEKNLKNLIEDSSPDAQAFPTTKERVELGKMLYLIQDFLKVELFLVIPVII